MASLVLYRMSYMMCSGTSRSGIGESVSGEATAEVEYIEVGLRAFCVCDSQECGVDPYLEPDRV